MVQPPFGGDVESNMGKTFLKLIDKESHYPSPSLPSPSLPSPLPTPIPLLQDYTNHKTSFTHRAKQHSTELSKYIWQLKGKGADYDIKWKILKQAAPYNIKTDFCATARNITP